MAIFNSYVTNYLMNILYSFTHRPKGLGNAMVLPGLVIHGEIPGAAGGGWLITEGFSSVYLGTRPGKLTKKLLNMAITQ